MKAVLLAAGIIMAAAPPAQAEEEIRCKVVQEEGSKYPPLKTGFLVDLDPEGRDGFFYLGLDVVDWKWFDQQFSVDTGIASGRIVTGLSWSPLFDGKVGPFIWAGYNIADNAAAYGIGFTVLKL